MISRSFALEYLLQLYYTCRPITETIQSGVYQFDGTGYASRDQIRYAADKYDVFFDFKAIWKDALLFFMANDTTVCRCLSTVIMQSYNNNNNTLIYIAPACRMTSVIRKANISCRPIVKMDKIIDRLVRWSKLLRCVLMNISEWF